jgi:hypothetical protein
LHYPGSLKEAHAPPKSGVAGHDYGYACSAAGLEAAGDFGDQGSTHTFPLVGGLNRGKIDDGTGSIVSATDHADNAFLHLSDKEFGSLALVDSHHGVDAVNLRVAELLIGL